MTCDLANPIFTDEAKATAHMEADRWPDGAFCPHCGSFNVHKMAGKTQAGMFLCNDCREKFTVRTGAIFERSHIPLHKWLLATHLMAASKKGMSALQLSRMLGLPYKTSWFLCHRIRESMKPTCPAPIGGESKIVEADESFFGGKAKNRAYAKNEPKMTDELASYEKVGKEFANHGTVNHSANEFAKLGGFAHTNTAECRFSLMKRAVFGTHHSISEAHLPRYLAEWDFKWNTRNITDGERATLALKGAEGRRLTYRQPRDAAHA